MNKSLTKYATLDECKRCKKKCERGRAYLLFEIGEQGKGVRCTKRNKTNRLLTEKITVVKMIEIYCEGNHYVGSLCEGCRHLRDYAIEHISSCKFGNDKPTCAKCGVHCYSPHMQEKIKTVMRYSGPRMLFIHPILTLKHMLHSFMGR